MNASRLSRSAEMYLKAMLEMSEYEPASAARLAERLGVSPVSASEMIHKLAELGLAKHTPYKGVALTQKGREVACDVTRRQRLWEVFLHDHLKIEWAKIYELACDLEHATAPEVTEALANFLGDPRVCPRGNPIPDAKGSFVPLNGVPLSSLQAGDSALILAVNATATDMLKYLQERNLLPARKLDVLEVSPFQGPLLLRVEGKEVALGLQPADFVIVKRK